MASSGKKKKTREQMSMKHFSDAKGQRTFDHSPTHEQKKWFRMLVYNLGGVDFFSTTFFPLIFLPFCCPLVCVMYASRYRVYRGNDATSIVCLNINLQLKLLFQKQDATCSYSIVVCSWGEQFLRLLFLLHNSMQLGLSSS